MSGSVRGEELWPIVADLGAMAARGDLVPAIDAALQRLASSCSGEVVLWELQANENPLAERVWQRFGAPGTASAIPTVMVTQVAHELRTLTVQVPALMLAIPVISMGKLRGVLTIRARQSTRELLVWRDALETFAPILGNFVVAAQQEQVQQATTAFCPLVCTGTQAELNDLLERELVRSRRARQTFALLMIGLDRYESLGLELGPALREQVMAALVITLRDVRRDGDIIGRIGDDRFVILLADSNAEGARLTARRYLDYLYRRPVTLPGGEQLYLDVSIGIALFPVDGLTIAEIIESAESAMREAQRLGGRRAVAR